LHDASFEHDGQLSQFGQLQISTRIHVIYSGINSNLNLPWILKGFKPWEKNLINFLKIYLELIFTKVNSVGHTCMQENEVSIQVSYALIWE
jgi:hypothetical protein